MLARAGTAKKATSKFEDSGSSHMSRPRTMSGLSHRPAPRVPPRLRTAAAAAAAVGSEASGARHRGLGAGRGTPPRSPLHEKKPAVAGAGGGAGSRVAELEAKLGKAHVQLTEMREQLAAAGKARKDARAAFDEAKKRFAAKQGDVATSPPVEDGHDGVPPEQSQQAEAVKDDVTDDGSEEAVRSMTSECKTTNVGDEENNVALVNELGSKLVAKDREAYEVKAKLMVRDMEVDALRVELTARDAGIEELTAKLVSKDAEIAALRADNAALVKTASEAAEAARETTAANARETERALTECAARESQLAERLAASERAREALEAEARRSRVQSEQWRKAAEEAAAVLGGAGHHVGAPGDKDMQRYGSVGGIGEKMDKQDADGEGSGGKRKPGGAVRLLADLWKKKAQK